MRTADTRLLNGALIVLTLCLFAVCLAFRQKSRETELLRDGLAVEKKAHADALQMLGKWEAKYPQQVAEFRKESP